MLTAKNSNGKDVYPRIYGNRDRHLSFFHTLTTIRQVKYMFLFYFFKIRIINFLELKCLILVCY